MSDCTNKTILCIDDDDLTLDYHRVLLERCGYAVLTAASGRRGLEIVGVYPVAVVVVDYEMPEMNGDEVAAAIKCIEPTVPVVMVSNSDKIPEEASRVVDAFVPKVEAADRLLPVIMQFCGDSPPKIRGG